MTLQVLHSRATRCFLAMLVPLICLSGPSALPAQTGKELVADACYNARHQLEHKTLWQSQIERRTAGHVYLEEEIETVDGPIRRLISVDGHKPSPSERKQDDDKLRDPVQNPKAQQALKKDSTADERKFDDLLRVIPEAFLFEDQGNQGGLEKIAFRPNPAYIPKTYEERALHAMSGIILIYLQEKRLVQLSATLAQQVDFGCGVLGHLNKGGTINLTRVRVSPGIWKTSSSKIDIGGRVVLFKTISKQCEETHSGFKLVASDTDIAQALQQLGGASLYFQ
ncbi:hypothetical protein JAO29_19760 [Edaphobacter sp. HDX4]|uniref:hypothetical protein n=1 Tax=Edaphobacter sp. HDX4 TaxID=2794064 RepID=UPI002FE689DC